MSSSVRVKKTEFAQEPSKGLWPLELLEPGDDEQMSVVFEARSLSPQLPWGVWDPIGSPPWEVNRPAPSGSFETALFVSVADGYISQDFNALHWKEEPLRYFERLWEIL